jgi:predicted metal-dependent phosphoesterase TrpH
MKLNIHTHTNYSHDSFMSVNALFKECQKQKFDCIAITDHDTIEGALKFRKYYGDEIKVIIGEEILTKDGDIVGLFLTKRIKPRMSAATTIKEIKKQNGLVMIPHPFDRLVNTKLKEQVLSEIIDSVDIIETYNAKTVFNKDNIKADAFADKHKKIKARNSDSHCSIDLRTVSMNISDFRSKKDFLINMKKQRYVVNKKPIYFHFLTITLVLLGQIKLLFRRGK